MVKLRQGQSLLRAIRTRLGDLRWRLRMASRRRLPHFEQALGAMVQSWPNHSVRAIWGEFAASTLVRGQQAIRTINRFATIKGTRCLDIGCAYGGFPAAFALAGAASVVGIELDGGLLTAARALLRDVRRRGELLQGDVMDRQFIRSLGTFDIITCNDVIEHVEDPGRLIEHIDQLLRPGGFVFMEIPNRRCVEAVLKDGHYGLFGITLLDRARSLRYYQQFFDEPYGVGQYTDLPECVALLRRRKIEPRCVDRPNYPSMWIVRMLRSQMSALSDERAELIGRLHLRDETTRQDLAEAVQEYLDGFARMDGQYRASTDGEQRQRLQQEMVRTYHQYMWQVVGAKEPNRTGDGGGPTARRLRGTAAR